MVIFQRASASYLLEGFIGGGVELTLLSSTESCLFAGTTSKSQLLGLARPCVFARRGMPRSTLAKV